jgi:predicted DNA-binding protein with PD1-like motif
MKVHREDDGRLILSLARGESIRESIESLAHDEGIVGAKLSAIGAIEDPELGLYMWPSKTYARRDFPGIWELLSLEGNISLLEGKPFMHAHITISGHDYNVLGGHLFDARVAVVFECFIEPVTTPLLRLPCEAIGLPRWEPGDLA